MLRTKLLPFLIAASLAIAPQTEAQTSEPALVEIDGTALNVHAIGLDQARDAKVVVVFESGFVYAVTELVDHILEGSAIRSRYSL